ncbi:RIP metalloprotease RseP [Candidatus Wolfebacteria bacterium]|nr:RIP metalloprotease RseP [Candidatus Wolfebacteria bacterium]
MITALIIIIFLSVLVLIHELGHFLTAKKFNVFIEEFGIGLPPRIFGKKKGEITYSVNALPIGGFVKIAGENREESVSEQIPKDRIFYNLKIWKRFLILIAGVAMNFLFGWVLVSLIFFIGIPRAVVITQVQADTPASQIGLKKNDIVAGFKNTDEIINFITRHKGREIELKIEREGKEMIFKMTPRINPPEGQGALGIVLADIGQERQGVLKSVWDGFKASVNIFAMVFVGIAGLLKSAILGKASLEAVTGPVGIVKVTAQAAHLGFVYLIQLLALISLNLAALNIFPFPALDGGRLLFLAIEKIKGSPLPKRFEQYVNAFGLVLLLILMAVITVKDITRIF